MCEGPILSTHLRLSTREESVWTEGGNQGRWLKVGRIMELRLDSIILRARIDGEQQQRLMPR